MSTKPKRIQMTRQKPWRADNPDAVIVARPSKWGSPFPVGRSIGQKWTPDGPVDQFTVHDRAHATDLYRRWLGTAWYGARRAVDSLPELRGRDLACWCPLDQPCHADVLLELANRTPSEDCGIDRTPNQKGDLA